MGRFYTFEARIGTAVVRSRRGETRCRRPYNNLRDGPKCRATASGNLLSASWNEIRQQDRALVEPLRSLRHNLLGVRPKEHQLKTIDKVQNPGMISRPSGRMPLSRLAIVCKLTKDMNPRASIVNPCGLSNGRLQKFMES